MITEIIYVQGKSVGTTKAKPRHVGETVNPAAEPITGPMRVSEKFREMARKAIEEDDAGLTVPFPE